MICSFSHVIYLGEAGNNGTKSLLSSPGRKDNCRETSEKIIVVKTDAEFAYSF